jgi:hypothetical protein
LSDDAVDLLVAPLPRLSRTLGRTRAVGTEGVHPALDTVFLQLFLEDAVDFGILVLVLDLPSTLLEGQLRPTWSVITG